MKANEKPRSTGRFFSGKGALSGALSRVPRGVKLPSVGLMMVAVMIPATAGGVPFAGPSDVELSPLAVVLPDAGAFPDLPEDGQARVNYWVRRFTTDQRGTFELFLTQETVFGELIREKLTARDMPEKLLYLAMIESGLRPRATSRVEAAGVWQFMGPTAEAYGLRVDHWVDERRDPVKATDAALDYLQWLHEQYDSWYLAAAAYNAGPTRINRLLKRIGWDGEDGDALYWEIRDLLPMETREYVPRMLAAAFLARGDHDHDFQQVKQKDAYSFDRVWVPGGTALHEVADRLGVERNVVWALNPHLTQGRTPPGEAYPLRVPDGSAFQVVATLGGRPWSPRLVDD